MLGIQLSSKKTPSCTESQTGSVTFTALRVPTSKYGGHYGQALVCDGKQVTKYTVYQYLFRPKHGFTKNFRQFTDPYFAGKVWIVDAGFYCSVFCCFCHFINSLYWQQKQASIACCQSKQYLHCNRCEELDASSILRQIVEKKKNDSLNIDHVTFQKKNGGNRPGEKMIDEGILWFYVNIRL